MIYTYIYIYACMYESIHLYLLSIAEGARESNCALEGKVQ